MPQHNLKVILTFAVLSSFSLLTYADEGFPLRNGNFSNINRPLSRKPLHDWHVIGFANKSLRVEKLKEQLKQQANMLVLGNPGAGRNLIYQDVYLPAGEYEFMAGVEIASKAHLTLRIGDINQRFESTSGQKTIKLGFKVAKSGTVRVHMIYGGSGKITIRNARVNIKKMNSSCVGLETGDFLGAIILPEKPTAAERYAAFELQKYITKITGKTVGVQGRDKTSGHYSIRIAKADELDEARNKLKDAPEDSYMIWTEGKIINLVGKNDRGVLYAAYDFLKAQGCGWYWPGSGGEVIPKLDKLKFPGDKIEKPDWDIRTIMRHGQGYDAKGMWWRNDKHAYFDWAVRNRLNTVWIDWATTSRLGEHRGGSCFIHTNHSYFRFWLDEKRNPIKAEWAPLVRGKRLSKHVSGRVNIPCLSNPELRARTVKIVLDFFKNNPDAYSYGINADDEPAFWCECEECRKLDPDKGKKSWKTGPAGRPEIGMSDRVLDYVNYVTREVTRVYPDKFIELYSYSSVTRPPAYKKVHPKVIVKVCAPPAYPLNWPMDNNRYWSNRYLKCRLGGWKTARVKQFALYDYGNYFAPDTPLFWFYHTVDSLKFYNQKWGMRNYVGENDSNFKMSVIAYNLRARALWDSNINYKKELKNICEHFYGQAGDIMSRYYLAMENVAGEYWENQKNKFPIVTSKARTEDMPTIRKENTNYLPMKFVEYSVDSMKKGRKDLQKAWEMAAGNRELQRRLAPAVFAHDYMTYIIIKKSKKLTPALLKLALKSYSSCKQLQKKYGLLLTLWGKSELQIFYFPPLVNRTVYKIPIEFAFRKDPKDVGLKERWYAKSFTEGAQKIRTDNFWTRQGISYHGVAWYFKKFRIPADRKINVSRLAVYFGAIDGFADVYLDGELIGQQKKKPLFMWDKPFAISLPENFDPSVGHNLIIRVEKKGHAAGIWKPVSIVELQSN